MIPVCLSRPFLMGLAVSGVLWGMQARAQRPADTPSNVVSLTASAQIEAAQDTLMIVLGTTREGPEAQAVQAQLRQVLDAALTQSRAAAVAVGMEVRTGQFSLHPRQGRDGRINGWQGSVELVLEGRDFARISAMAGKVQGLNVQQVGYSLSREQRLALESQVQARAIEAWQAKAHAVARSFGFAGWQIREANISSQDVPMHNPRPRMLAMAKAQMDADTPLPVEAGKASVTVVVSGSVQLLK